MCENKTASFFKDLLSMWRVWQLFVGNGKTCVQILEEPQKLRNTFIFIFFTMCQYLDYQYKYWNQGEA